MAQARINDQINRTGTDELLKIITAFRLYYRIINAGPLSDFSKQFGNDTLGLAIFKIRIRSVVRTKNYSKNLMRRFQFL